LLARRLPPALLLVVALLGAGGFGGIPGPSLAVRAGAQEAAGTQDASALRIRMFGDSVMLGARDDLMAALPGTDTYVDAVEGRSLLGTTPVLVAHPDLLGDVVVLDLGYNDMPDAGVFHDRVDAMMQALAGVPRVVWLTQSLFQPARGSMNDELRAAAARYPNLDVVDWDAQVSAHPEYVYADGLHLTPAGRAAFAGAVKDRVDAYRASLARDTHTSASSPPATSAPAVSTAGAGAQTTIATPAAARAAASAERGAESAAASPTAGPTSRTFAAVAIGLVALVVLAGAVMVRRSRSLTSDPDQSMRQRPVPLQSSHSGAPPVA
jgi:hypothetical protein